MHTLRLRQLLECVFRGGSAAREPLLRAKMVVVGRGGAGKTSTVNALLGRAFNVAEASTVGCCCTSSETAVPALGRTEAAAWAAVSASDQDQGEVPRVLSARLTRDALQLPKTDGVDVRSACAILPVVQGRPDAPPHEPQSRRDLSNK